ncbi:MAG: pyruvate, phosphate dikinase [Dehalococcoidia bacterium]
MAVSVERKLVYPFRDGSASMRDLLGSKGANLCEMTRLGIPVPPGFVITTDACREYYAQGKGLPEGLWDQVMRNVQGLEEETGKRVGSAESPLIVSVRSGAAVSMPGMMDTILNLGMNDAIAPALGRLMGDPRYAVDAHRRLIQGFGHVVLGLPREPFEEALTRSKERAGVQFDYELESSALEELVEEYKGVIQSQAGREFPQDPWEQLRAAIEAVFRSWNTPRAVTYRDYHGISHDLGTAVTVMLMVFGNLGPDSGTGVLFTRNPSTGEKGLYGEYLANAQGEDVVAGVRTPEPIAQLAQWMPSLYQQLTGVTERLERHYRDVQDVEFTVERGRLYVLQTRTGKRTAPAAVKIAVDMVQEGIITREEALQRMDPNAVSQILLPRFDPQAKEEATMRDALLAQGFNASPGAATGEVVLDADEAVRAAENGKRVILVRPETSPDDVHGILKAVGVLTSRGGVTSHAAVVTRGLGKPCVVGCEELTVDLEGRRLVARGVTLREYDEISIDGATGEVFVGRISTVPPQLHEMEELMTLLGWADAARRLGVWANADTPEDAARALELGAEGIGLCRTEHMFFQPERLPLVRQLLLSATEAQRLEAEVQALRQQLAEGQPGAGSEERLKELEAQWEASPAVRQYREALQELERFQIADFLGIFRVMVGKPVVVRLLDAPLHEFLPPYEELLIEVTRLQAQGVPTSEVEEKARLLNLVRSLREANPMLGHRGCRVGLTFPEIYEMQMRAIVTAAGRLAGEGVEVHPEVMIPLTAHINELRWLRQRLVKVAEGVPEAQGVSYKFGTMIEVPRAALTAGEVAQEADFFSFGSNDLTQTTYGFSRDDAEGKFLGFYLEQGILPVNPFQTLDPQGVGRLIELGTEEGRRTCPDLKVGICGEHGGDPESIAFCHQVGLDYVSCSPFRVPQARLAAAQAALRG